MFSSNANTWMSFSALRLTKLQVIEALQLVKEIVQELVLALGGFWSNWRLGWLLKRIATRMTRIAERLQGGVLKNQGT